MSARKAHHKRVSDLEEERNQTLYESYEAKDDSAEFHDMVDAAKTSTVEVAQDEEANEARAALRQMVLDWK